MSEIKIDGQAALALAGRLSFPRFPGGSEERRARLLLKNEMERLGYRTEEQGFSYDTRRAEALRLLSPLLPALLLSGCVVASIHAPIASWLAATLGLAAPLLVVRWRWIEKLFEGDRLASANLIAFRPATVETARPALLFVAHVDSKSQTLGFVTRAFLAAILALSALGTWGLLGARALHPEWEAIGSLLGVVVVVLFAAAAPLALNLSGDRSPGALDNAAGCGCLVEIARVLARGTDLPYEPVFVFTGAEEASMVGAARLSDSLQRRGTADRLHPSRCAFVNFDGVGAGDGLLGMPHAPRRPLARPLVRAARDAAAACGVTLRIAPFIPATGVDGVPLAARGFRGITLLSATMGRAARRVHTAGDRPENLDPAALERAGRVAIALAERLANA